MVLIMASVDQNPVLCLQSMESKKQLEESQLDFQVLVKEGNLPPKMELKLHYLSAAVSGHEVDAKLIQGLPQFQKLSLQMMNRDTKLTLFCSIVKCLAGREVVTYFTAERVSFKKENGEARSVTCYATCNSNHLIVARNKENTDVWFSFLIERLLVAKLYHREKKKFYFPVVYDNVKYRFKFDHEGPCARIHGALLTAIREKKSLKARQDNKSSFGDSRLREELEAEFWDETGQERILDEERQYLLSLVEKINSSDLHKNEGFQLLRNVDGGKITVNRGKNMVNILLFLERCTVQGLIESYINFDAWNVHVDSFKIVKKIRNNTFVGHLRLKKKNFFTAARSSYFVVNYFKMCHCLNKNTPEMPLTKHYLLITTIDHNDMERSGSEGVAMTFNQIVEFSEVEGRPGVVFVNVLSHIDFNVYQLLSNTIDLNLQFNEEISSIGVLCHERQMMKEHKTQLFDFGVCVCDRKKVRQHMSSPEHKKNNLRDPRKGSMLSEYTQDQDSSVQAVEAQIILPRKQILQAIQENNDMKINEKIVEVIQKKVYQKYYLREKFSFEVNQQSYIESDFHLKERTNFLMLNKRWKLTNSEDYVFIDEEELQLQKGILKLIVKQITANLMAGKSIMSMSLPVEIFDDYSTLEGFSWVFGFIPVFMHKALQQKNIEEQIKYVGLAIIFMFACNPKTSKPFNPILGETCECRIGGIPFYMEQISHHPPISAFLMKTDKFQISGCIDVLVDVGLNSAHTKMPSPIKVKIYQNNTEYIVRMPDVEMSGVMFGDRILYLSGRGYVLEKKSGTYLQYSVGKDKKKLYEYKQKIRKCDLAGGVFKITKQAVDRLLAIDVKKSIEGIRHDEAIERCSLITGKWYGDIYFDGVCYKSVKEGPFPVQIERPTVLLPSDCTFRLDIVYRRWRNFKKSNEEKEVLENMQRRDRRLREKHHPPKH